MPAVAQTVWPIAIVRWIMKADSKASTEQLWRLLSNGLRSFLRQRVPDDAIADDLVQETFLRVHQRRESVRDDQSLTSWVYQIARNLVIDYYRREGSQVSKLEGQARLAA